MRSRVYIKLPIIYRDLFLEYADYCSKPVMLMKSMYAMNNTSVADTLPALKKELPHFSEEEELFLCKQVSFVKWQEIRFSKYHKQRNI
jgi:hypothetical protein